MAKFGRGAPQVTFIKRNGSKFTMTYHSRLAAAKAIKAWRSRGGRVFSTGVFGSAGTIGRWSMAGRVTRRMGQIQDSFKNVSSPSYLDRTSGRYWQDQ